MPDRYPMPSGSSSGSSSGLADKLTDIAVRLEDFFRRATFFALLVLAMIAGGLTGLVFAFQASFSSFAAEVDNLAEYRPPEITKVYADDGKTVIGELSLERRIPLDYSQIPEQLKQAFHPGATMFFARNDSLIAVPIPEYIARVAESRAKGPPPQRTERIAHVDISGTSAVAQLELEYPNQKITDYMSLVKYGGEWRIVNKIFSRESVAAK